MNTDQHGWEARQTRSSERSALSSIQLMVAENEANRWGDGSKLIHKDLTYQILGAAMEVLNHHGHGLHEKIYENSIVVEMKRRNINVDQQHIFPVTYKEVPVGTYIPDLLIGASVIVDTKVVDRIGNLEVGQVMNYLRITRLKLGLILNFKYPKLQHQRVLADPI